MTVYTTRALDLKLPQFGPVELVDVIANGDGRLLLEHDGVVLLDDPVFPIVELGRDLSRWMKRGEVGGYLFDSMSFEEPGSIRIQQLDGGWAISSDLAKEAEYPPERWASVLATVERFVADVAIELERVGWRPLEVLNAPYASEI